MIKNYIFDLGNVVLILRWDKILDKYNINNQEKDLLNKHIFESDEWVKLDEGTISKKEAIDIMKSNLPENLHSICEDIMNSWHSGLVINNEIIDLINEMREKGYNTYVLSNAPLDIDEFLEENDLKKYFDGIILSAFDKMLKPNKEIYDLLLDRFKLNADECYFIDDKKINIEGAKAQGIDGFVFDYKNIRDLRNCINL